MIVNLLVGTVNLVELATAETIDWLLQGVEGGWVGEHRCAVMASRTGELAYSTVARSCVITGSVATPGDPNLGGDLGCGDGVVAEGVGDDGCWYVQEVLAGAVALCEAGAGEIVDPGWSDRQGQLVEGSRHP
jgi:hypothetical protein